MRAFNLPWVNLRSRLLKALNLLPSMAIDRLREEIEVAEKNYELTAYAVNGFAIV